MGKKLKPPTKQRSVKIPKGYSYAVSGRYGDWVIIVFERKDLKKARGKRKK